MSHKFPVTRGTESSSELRLYREKQKWYRWWGDNTSGTVVLTREDAAEYGGWLEDIGPYVPPNTTRGAA